MMAKRPEDRFTSYADLITAAEEAAAGPEPTDRAAFPWPDEPEPVPPSSRPRRQGTIRRTTNPGAVAPSDEPYQVASLADLASDLDEDDHPHPSARQPSIALGAPLLRRTLPLDEDEEDADSSSAPDGTQSAPTSRSPGSVTVWILSSAIAAVACVLLGIGLVQFLGMSSGPSENVALSNGPDSVLDLNRNAQPLPRSTIAGTAGHLSSTSSSKDRWQGTIRRATEAVD